MLYEMLTGCPPCAGTDAIDVLHKKANEDPVPISSLRPHLPVEKGESESIGAARTLSTMAVAGAVIARSPAITRSGCRPSGLRGRALGEVAVHQFFGKFDADVLA